MKKIIFSCIMLIGALFAYAYDFKVNGIYYNITSSMNKTVEVTCKGDSSVYASDGRYYGRVNIPREVTYGNNTYSVARIGNDAFSYCYKLTEIAIPNSITEIGDRAFINCFGLPKIIIPSSVTSIGDEAFKECSRLVEISVPNTVIEIGEKAFRGTPWYNKKTNGLIYINNVLYGYKGVIPSNTSINIKDGTVSISPYAFAGNHQEIISNDYSGLTKVTIPNSVVKIGHGAFYGCSDLTSIIIPNSVTTIGDYAFSDCKRLTSINIPNSVTKIGIEAFNRTGWYYNQPNGIMYLDNCCLGKKGMLEELVIKDGTRLIADGAFQESGPCIKTKTVVIPNSVTAIGDYTFYHCKKLTKITIPNSVTTIGKYAFGGCSELTSVTIPNSVTTIGDFAFMECTSLTSVIIPNSVVTIGNYAFWGCEGLTKIIIPNSVTTIGDYAFLDCSRLTSLKIPKSVTEIGKGVSDKYDSRTKTKRP